MKKSILLASLILIAFSSCRKAPDYSDLKSDLIVSTSLDKNANFGSYTTFYVSDTVVNLGGSGADTILFDTGAQQLVQAVKNNMTARGYSFAARNNHPDLGITISVVKNTTVGVSYYYPGWYDGYYGYYDPYYWGGYYPYYYPYTTYYQYTTGTVITNLIDVKNAAQNQRYNVIWNATSFGVLGSSSTSNVQLAVESINQAFTQSPYLTK